MTRAIRASTFLVLLATFLSLAAEVRASDLKIGLVLTHRGRGEIDAKAIQVATEAFLFSRRFTVLERTGLDAVFQEKGLQGFIGGTDGTADLSYTQGLDWIGLLSYSVEQSRDR
ncbi:MAG TPA: hypothetical protein VLF66_05505, partial [Thermoanaerobaculia bacterium]|nr:hypothetical protein [Thermoanaerobaculia bacterium]